MLNLFEPLKIKDITIKNRIGMSPMCQYAYQDGMANDWLKVHLGARAVGGVGLILTEATAVEARGRISPFDLGIWRDEQIAPLKSVVDFINQQGAVAGIQLAHAGRKACTMPPFNGGKPISNDNFLWWQAVAPSDIPFSELHQKPVCLTLEDLLIIKNSFKAAAVRALTAGFQWLEVHAAHGYLLHSFLSPLSNHRDDEYGGSFENRIRLLLEVIESIKIVWPENLPLTVRISGTDWVEGGWTVFDSVQLAITLKEAGVDLIDCSSGGMVPKADIPVGSGFQVFISDKVKAEAKIKTAAVGLITAPAQADTIIRLGQADMVLLGRELLRNPYWPIKAAKKLGSSIQVSKYYERAY
ncbi:MAG: oxidoreductase [Anaerolineaceae bacterium]|nr:oxidoreductase [Anaerolineaceae bacterium]